ncbi:MAG: zinc ABC transporter substrate-binding protein [Clostridia bacterium]|nr:zinc ABC transporter substrate-binding protein [Clostridia bacterium]
MKSTFRHYAPVALLLAVILLAATCLSLLTGDREQGDRPRVLVTTYPLYVAAQNILGDTDGVQLTMLSAVGAGCLHDYQLTPADRLALERADLVMTNGVGAEPFLEGLVEEHRLVDTAVWVEPLCSDHHHGAEEHHHHEDHNEHVWVSPTQYQKQVVQVAVALRSVDRQNSARYEQNAKAYQTAIKGVEQRLPNLNGRPCVLFHDSLSYLAADVGLDVKLTMSADGESGLSANHLAQVERLAKEHPDLVLLYDTQYPIRYTAVDGLVPAAQVISLETAVVGDGKPTDWLDAMNRNLDKLQTLTEGGDAP